MNNVRNCPCAVRLVTRNINISNLDLEQTQVFILYVSRSMGRYRPLTDEELQKFYAAIGNHAGAMRDHLLFRFMETAGMKVVDVLALQWHHLLVVPAKADDDDKEPTPIITECVLLRRE